MAVRKRCLQQLQLQLLLPLPKEEAPLPEEALLQQSLLAATGGPLPCCCLLLQRLLQARPQALAPASRWLPCCSPPSAAPCQWGPPLAALAQQAAQQGLRLTALPAAPLRPHLQPALPGRCLPVGQPLACASAGSPSRQQRLASLLLQRALAARRGGGLAPLAPLRALASVRLLALALAQTSSGGQC